MENENRVRPTYQEKFDSFMEDYKRGETDGEMVGKVIAHMAQEFASYNMILADEELRFNKIVKEEVQSIDELTGKPISVSKAEIIVKATTEYENVRRAKANLENIDNYINALKYLQKGVLNEFSHMSGT